MSKLSYNILAAAALLGLAACSENVLTDSTGVTSQKGLIQFGYNLPNGSTRTVLTSQTGFPEGSAMAVDGFQMTEQGDTYRLFADDKVTKKDDANWTYDNDRYWDIASTYVFYAMYPYNVTHVFDKESRMYTLENYTVANDKAAQEDVMIAEEKKAMPENLVTFNFNHLLSQVNFYLKASADLDLSGIEGIELTSFDLLGVKNTGTFAQTGWDSETKNVRGSWSVSENTGEYDMPTVTSADMVTATNPVSSIETGLLMLPQSLAEVQAVVSYRIHYGKGVTSAYTTKVNLASALISKKHKDDGDNSQYIQAWKPNYVYRYNLAVNPTKRTITDDGVDIDGSKDGDGNPTTDASIVIDPEGNWWVDEDGDGIGDVPIVWEDIDGDGREEGGIDRDGDGHIDNIDGDNENPDNNPLVSDGDPNNPDGKDAIIVDTDGDGVGDTQLERDDDRYYPEAVRSMKIEFSADVEDFDNEIDADM